MVKLKNIVKSAGPGLITGVADDDPSGIATYAQTGAMFGVSQLWLALFTLPFMIAIQEMCGRIGMVTGQGLSSVIKQYYSKKILYSAIALLAITNIINIGADLGAMASAAQLISPFSFSSLLVGLSIFTVLVEILVPYKVYVRFLKYLALTVFAYILAAFAVHQDWGTIFLATITPHIEWNTAYLLNITAMLGTTISPYLFFWQANQEIEESLLSGKMVQGNTHAPKINNHDISQMRSDTALGMFVSNLVTFFIIITTAGTLGVHGIREITSASQVAEALRPFAGNASYILFTLGILGTGLLAVPVLAGSAAYAIAEAFGWKSGLGKTFTQAKAFYWVIIVSTLIGVCINVSHINPIAMLYYAAALNGILAPPLMILILCIANNKKILGAHVNSFLSNTFGVCITVCMSIISIFFIVNMMM
jgi:Mn2+/Fe2+ NRAMP family transporter